MKKNLILVFVLTVIIFSSCKKEEMAPTGAINEMVEPTAILRYSGNFTSGPYGTVSGKAQVYEKDSMFTLQISSFNSTNGPALHVYLSKEAMPVNYFDLGSLKSTNGSQVYTITGRPDFMDYKYISVHCVDYNHLFGSALLN